MWNPQIRGLSVKKEGNSIYAATGMILEDITLSKITQPQNDKYCMIVLRYVS
jgi:hypothetical protein